MISISALLHVHVFVFVIGVSVSKPHLVEFLDEMSVCLSSVCTYHTLCCKSLAALISHSIASYINPKLIHKWVELKTRTLKSLSPRWCHYLYCCLTHRSCVEVTQWWGLVHIENGGRSALSMPSQCKLHHIVHGSCRAHVHCAGLLHWTHNS